MRSNTKIWIEGTIIAALSIMLSFLPTGMGTTFSISLGQITLTVYALRRGVKPAMLAELIWGFLHFPLGQVIYLSVAQVLIEYILAYLFAGLLAFLQQDYTNRFKRKITDKLALLLLVPV